MDRKAASQLRSRSRSRGKNKIQGTHDPDYLDAAGVAVNFMTGIPYTQAYRDLARSSWAKLPLYIDPIKVSELLSSLHKNSVTVVISATGSGKSVIIPRLAMKFLQERAGKEATHTKPRLAMTFPKQILAQESAKFASRTWDVTLGAEVGYQFRGSPPTSHSPETRALFMTDGTLFTMSRKDPAFSSFDLVILDEAHERSVQTDLLLARLRASLETRPTFRLIIMSATIDPGIFATYFQSSHVIRVAGQPSFPIDHHWEQTPVTPDGSLVLAVQRATSALNSESIRQPGSSTVLPSDVLVFVPTTKDATKGCRLLHATKTAVTEATLCEGLYRRLPDDQKDTVIHGRPVPPMTHKVVFATPIAESSITLPELGTVVDSGLQLSSVWLAREQATRITRGMTTQAQIAQRVGRVGRTAPGVAYHIYTKKQFAALKPFPDPAILHTDLTEHFLAELCSRGKGLTGVLWDCSGLMTPPHPDQTQAAVNTLRQLGLVGGGSSARVGVEVDCHVTELGRAVQGVCDRFKLSLSNALVMMGGALVGCREDAVILACILDEIKGELSDLWSMAVAASGDPRTPLLAHLDPLSDHVSLVNVYRKVYLGRSSVDKARGALYEPTWDRIHERILRDGPRFAAYQVRLDLAADGYTAVAPPGVSVSFYSPLVRAVAFARRHRHFLFTGRDQRGKASSAGPLQSTSCWARPMLAAPSQLKSCLGGLYDDIVEVGGSMSFSIITWIHSAPPKSRKSVRPGNQGPG